MLMIYLYIYLYLLDFQNNMQEGIYQALITYRGTHFFARESCICDEGNQKGIHQTGVNHPSITTYLEPIAQFLPKNSVLRILYLVRVLYPVRSP